MTVRDASEVKGSTAASATRWRWSRKGCSDGDHPGGRRLETAGRPHGHRSVRHDRPLRGRRFLPVKYGPRHRRRTSMPGHAFQGPGLRRDLLPPMRARAGRARTAFTPTGGGLPALAAASLEQDGRTVVKFAFVLDPLEGLKAYKDSSVAMMRAACARPRRSGRCSGSALPGAAVPSPPRPARGTVRKATGSGLRRPRLANSPCAIRCVLMRQDPRSTWNT